MRRRYGRLFLLLVTCCLLVVVCVRSRAADRRPALPVPLSVTGYVDGRAIPLEPSSRSFTLLSAAVEGLLQVDADGGPLGGRGYVHAVKSGNCDLSAGDVSELGLELIYPKPRADAKAGRYTKAFMAFGDVRPLPAQSGYSTSIDVGKREYERTLIYDVFAAAGEAGADKIVRVRNVIGLALLRPAAGKGYCRHPSRARSQVARVARATHDFLQALVLSHHFQDRGDGELAREYETVARLHLSSGARTVDLGGAELLGGNNGVVPQVNPSWKPQVGGGRATSFASLRGVDARGRERRQEVRFELERIGGRWRITAFRAVEPSRE